MTVSASSSSTSRIEAASAVGHGRAASSVSAVDAGSAARSARPAGRARSRARQVRSPAPRRVLPSPRRGRGRRRGRCRSRAGILHPCAARDRTSRTVAGRASGGTPGPPSSTTTVTVRPEALAETADRRIGSPVVRGVVERVREDLADEDLVDHDGWQIRRDPDLHVVARQARTDRRTASSIRSPSANTAEARAKLARFHAAHVEEVRDQPIEPLGLGVDRSGDLAALVGRPLHIGVHQRARRGSDRRQWRTQVVGDRVEQGRLERVAPAGDLGRRGLALEPIALE